MNTKSLAAGFISKGANICRFLLILSVAVGVLSCSIGRASSNAPTDAALKEVFDRNRSDFDLLLRMSRSDRKVIRIADDFTWLDDNAKVPRSDSELGFSKERWQEYKVLFDRLKLNGGVLQYPDSGVTYLIASSEGMLTGGALSKGYVFSAKGTSGLDEVDKPNELEYTTTYVPLGDNWFIYTQGN